MGRLTIFSAIGTGVSEREGAGSKRSGDKDATGIDPRERRRNFRKSGNVCSRKRKAHGKPTCNHNSKGYKDRVKITSTEKQHQSRTETSRVREKVDRQETYRRTQNAILFSQYCSDESQGQTSTSASIVNTSDANWVCWLISTLESRKG